MRPQEPPLANPDFPHDRLEPAERPREGKEDRAVHEKDLGKGGGRPFLPCRHPPIVERAVTLPHIQSEIPYPDPGDGKIPGEETDR